MTSTLSGYLLPFLATYYFPLPLSFSNYHPYSSSIFAHDFYFLPFPSLPWILNLMGFLPHSDCSVFRFPSLHSPLFPEPILPITACRSSYFFVYWCPFRASPSFAHHSLHIRLLHVCPCSPRQSNSAQFGQSLNIELAYTGQFTLLHSVTDQAHRRWPYGSKRFLVSNLNQSSSPIY